MSSKFFPLTFSFISFVPDNTSSHFYIAQNNVKHDDNKIPYPDINVGEQQVGYNTALTAHNINNSAVCMHFFVLFCFALFFRLKLNDVTDNLMREGVYVGTKGMHKGGNFTSSVMLECLYTVCE
jgi:sorbitol-specific phosphotransferase system component IIC